LAKSGIELVAVDSNPIDAVWSDQPKPSEAPIFVHPDELAGKSSAQKRNDIARWLAAEDADATVLCALDSVAWTFNLRGGDVERTPVALAYAIVHRDGTADLFVAPGKIPADVQEQLGSSVRLHPRGAFSEHLRSFASKSIAVDPERAVAVIFESLADVGAHVLERRDPSVLAKAQKNHVEVAGHRAAQARDGAALSLFLHWISIEAIRGGVTELSAAARLQAFREATGRLHDLSFDTISAFGPNGAVVHYGVSEKTNRSLAPGGLYLVDSGGQYVDGTTDVTRTIAIGEPTREMQDRFTRVLKGHILLASTIFPAGSRGGQLDILARKYLWDIGLDYAHGTGHGVGSFLSVHEGPQRIINPQAPVGGGEEPLMPGMIVSNEPGYYKTGEYGIRIENLMLVVERVVAGSDCKMLGFETLTFAPIDRALIVPALLTADEHSWIDLYHAEVMRVIGPQLQGAARSWLAAATRPLSY
jgi:Xaa-Pro aminopeptidase